MIGGLISPRKVQWGRRKGRLPGADYGTSVHTPTSLPDGTARSV